MSIDLNSLPEIKALKGRRRAFVLEYIVNGNGAESARNVGYSPKGARQSASLLLSNDDIKSAIRACEEAIANESELTVEWISNQIKDIAENTSAKPQDRLRALELLGKYKGMFRETTLNVALFGDSLSNKLMSNLAGVTERLEVIDIKGVTSEGEVN